VPRLRRGLIHLKRNNFAGFTSLLTQREPLPTPCRAERGWQAGKVYFHKSSSLEIEISFNVLGICEVCRRQIWASDSEPHIHLLSECDSTEATVREQEFRPS